MHDFLISQDRGTCWTKGEIILRRLLVATLAINVIILFNVIGW